MIIPVLVEAFKEQQKQIQDQQKDIDELKALVNNLVLNK
jgi:cell division protein FtsB